MTASAAVLTRSGLDELVDALRDDGYRVIGPTVRDDAIVLAELASGADLPSGWGVDAAPGSYRLRRRDDDAVFGHSAGAGSWKQFLHPPRQPLLQADATFADRARRRYAFLGVRACDLAAIATLGTVLGGGAHAGRCLRAPARGPVRRSRWAAPSRAACASARRWAPGPRPDPATTWPSPSGSTRAGTASSSRSAPPRARRCSPG